jgi:hypothetical protein
MCRIRVIRLKVVILKLHDEPDGGRHRAAADFPVSAWRSQVALHGNIFVLSYTY